MTGEPEGLQQPADQPTEEAAAATTPNPDSPSPAEEPTEDSAAPVEAEAPEPSAPEAAPAPVESTPPTEEAVEAPAPAEQSSAPQPPVLTAPAPSFSQAPALPVPKPSEPAPEPQAQPESSAAAAPAEPAAPVESGGMPGLPDGDAGAIEEATEEELEAIDEAVYRKLLEESASASGPLHEGERREGVIVSVSDSSAVVDVGGKTEAVLQRSALPEDYDWAALAAGSPITVYVKSLGSGGEYAQLGLAREENTEAWDALEEAMREKRTLEATVVERVKGGVSVTVGDLTAFLPGSQTGIRGGEDLDALIGKTLPVRVVKVSRRRGNAVVSHREILEEAAAELRKQALEKISVGSVVEGVVKNVTSYGAFIDLGGVDGLIHVTDISYGRVKDPASVLTPGQSVESKVIKIDEEKGRVSLSVKAMKPDPWQGLAERYQIGARVSGKVASVTDYGAFIELDDDVEGLVHITEMTWSKRLRHPSKILKVGQETEAIVLKVQPSERRISLSLKQVKSDPWEGASERYQTGTIVEGRVRNVTTYGAFVEIEEGVDGLVHVSDLSWDRNVKDPKQVLKKGQQIRAVVLDLNQETNQISLGVKQLEPDVWETYFGVHGVGETVTGSVARLAKFGAFVELAPGVEGLCHSSQIPGRAAAKRGGLEKGRLYRFEIIKVDDLDRRIGLRCVSPEPVNAETEPAGEA